MNVLKVTNHQTPEGEVIEMSSSAQPVVHAKPAPSWNLADQRTAAEMAFERNAQLLADAKARREARKPWWRVW
jgi:hypothetical protein